jgi:hypothetical protein
MVKDAARVDCCFFTLNFDFEIFSGAHKNRNTRSHNKNNDEDNNNNNNNNIISKNNIVTPPTTAHRLVSLYNEALHSVVVLGLCLSRLYW